MLLVSSQTFFISMQNGFHHNWVMVGEHKDQAME